jgi:hypothetical protein
MKRQVLFLFGSLACVPGDLGFRPEVSSPQVCCAC